MLCIKKLLCVCSLQRGRLTVSGLLPLVTNNNFNEPGPTAARVGLPRNIDWMLSEMLSFFLHRRPPLLHSSSFFFLTTPTCPPLDFGFKHHSEMTKQLAGEDTWWSVLKLWCVKCNMHSCKRAGHQSTYMGAKTPPKKTKTDFFDLEYLSSGKCVQ